MSKKNLPGLNRRNVLKGSVVGMLAAVSGTNLAAAKQDVELSAAEEAKLLRQFQSAEMVDLAVHEQSDLLDELAADGVLESATIGDLNRLTEPVDGVGEELTAFQVGEEFTPQIKIFRRTEAGYLSLSVFPEENEAHAVLNPIVGGEALGEGHLKTYGNPEDVSSQGCWDGGQCEDCDCNYYCCTRDASGDCLQWCNECSCGCTCCRCSWLCSAYC